MHRVDAAQIFIVKKVLHHIQREEGFVRNFEIRALTELPNCNRIVQMLAYQENTPEEGSGTIVYNWYPLGDVYHWKHQFFDDKNFKPVPESYIWRFYVQVRRRSRRPWKLRIAHCSR